MKRPCVTRRIANTVRFGAKASNAVGKDRKKQAQRDRPLALQRATDDAHQQAGNGHAERARVGGQADLGRGDAIDLREAGQDRLRREEIDERQKADDRDQHRLLQRESGRLGDLRGWAMSVIAAPWKRMASRPGRGGTPGLPAEEGRTPARGTYLPWNTSDESRTVGTLPWLTQ